MGVRSFAATNLSREQKDVLIRVWRAAAWWLKMPKRALRRHWIEQRLPPIRGRSWRTTIPPALHVSMVNGAIKYTYRGVRMVKHPVDLALYMKLLWELKPRSIIEIGNKDGGTATWFGDMLKLWGLPGLVVGIDLQPPDRPWCCPANVRFVQGNEADLSSLEAMFEDLPHPWLLINDASHNAKTMLPGMRYLHRFLERGDYFIIEDGFLTEAGLDWDGERNGGPGLAIAQFLDEHRGQYEVDARYCDHFGRNVTANPNGYLRRL